MNIFFSVGEPSGDLHGANLIAALQQRNPAIQLVGYGGPKMVAAGLQSHADLTQLAVMWFARAILNVHRFARLLWDADRYFRRHRPDAVVLIDYPGFNWWIARRAKRYSIPVFYYGTPQIWAWAGWRIKKMRRLIDHALCKLPFEEPWYRHRGVHATFVGHPYFDELNRQQLDRDFLDQLCGQGHLVTILPGSRRQELASNLPSMIEAAGLIRDQHANVRFAVAAFSEEFAEIIRQALSRAGLAAEIHVGRTAELIHAADCALAVSGSVSLELLYRTKPAVIFYCIGRVGDALQRRYRSVKYITLVNLLACDDRFGPIADYDPNDLENYDVPLPEYATSENPAGHVARHVLSWLTDDDARRHRVARLQAVRKTLATTGASDTAADYILDSLKGNDAAMVSSAPRPSAA